MDSISSGSLTSNGTIVTSLAGYPKKIEKLNVAVHNHTAVLLWWGIPSIQDLQVCCKLLFIVLCIKVNCDVTGRSARVHCSL